MLYVHVCHYTYLVRKIRPIFNKHCKVITKMGIFHLKWN